MRTEKGFVFKGGKTTCEKQPASATDARVTCNGVSFNVLYEFVASDGKIIRANAAPDPKLEGKQQYLGVSYTPPQTQTSASSCATTPEKWSMTLELRDAVSVGGSYQMSDSVTVDPETNEAQSKTIPFDVKCTDSTRAKPETGSVKELVAKTAKVTGDNDIYNKIYGMWVASNYLGPEEYVSVSDFTWVDPANPDRGFKLNIDTKAKSAILNIDISQLGITAGSAFQVEKDGTVLKTCGFPPCYQAPKLTTNKIVTLKLDEGDPTFTFAGFSRTAGLDAIPGAGIELTRKNPKYVPTGTTTTVIELFNALEDLKVTLTDFTPASDGFSIKYQTEPAKLPSPGAIIGFHLNAAGYTYEDADAVTVNVGDAKVTKCADASGKMGSESIYCYHVADNLLKFVTLGSQQGTPETIDVKGLTRRAEVAAITSMEEAKGDIVLTRAKPSQYGLTAANLDDTARITISNIGVSKPNGPVKMNVKAEGQSKDFQLAVEILPLNMQTIEGKRTNTTVELAGRPGVLKDCMVGEFAPCFVTRAVDRVVVNLESNTDTTMFIRNLAIPSNEMKLCSGKVPGTDCGNYGQCWEPPIEGVGKQCFSQCRREYYEAKVKAGAKFEFLKEEKFCVESASQCKKTGEAKTTAGLCNDPKKKICCSQGGGVQKAATTGKTGAGGETPSAQSSSVPCIPYQVYDNWYLAIDYKEISHLLPSGMTECTAPDTTVCWMKYDTKPSCPASKDIYRIEKRSSVVEILMKRSESGDLISSKNAYCGPRPKNSTDNKAYKNKGFRCVDSEIAGEVCSPKASVSGGGYFDSPDCSSGQKCCLPTTKTIRKSKNEMCNKQEKGYCGDKNIGLQISTDIGVSCEGDLRCMKETVVKFGAQSTEGIAEYFEGGLYKSITFDGPNGPRVEACEGETFAIPKYTEGRSTCVDPVNPGAAKAKFVAAYCDKLQGCVPTIVKLCDSDMRSLVKLCGYDRLPSECRTQKFGVDKKPYGVEGLFYENIELRSKCKNADLSPVVKFPISCSSYGKYATIYSRSCVSDAETDELFWRLLCTKMKLTDGYSKIAATSTETKANLQKDVGTRCAKLNIPVT
jgi:hypothetical protein